MNATMTLGHRIRQARKEAGLTQDDLADKIRARNSSSRLNGVRISRYERDLHAPRLPVLIDIADATEKPLDYFHVDADTTDEPDSEADEDDSETMLRAAYTLERTGNYVLADDLRNRARRAAMRRFRTAAAA